MRHEHAGLAVPDFPKAYGQWYPATDVQTLEAINFDRTVIQEIDPVTPFQIHAHMAHRVGALVILLAAISLGIWVARTPAARRAFGGITALWLGLIAVQLALGVFTVLRNKPADIATLHVVVGALSLCTAFLMGTRSARASRLLVQERARTDGAVLAPHDLNPPPAEAVA